MTTVLTKKEIEMIKELESRIEWLAGFKPMLTLSQKIIETTISEH